MELHIEKGSVVYADLDAITNAANEDLLAGSGVCGAIFDEAGLKQLQRECNAIGYCKTGHAVMTNGYNLKARHIIHAVGTKNGDENKLKSAFYNTLIIADSNNLKTLGLVPISAGIYGFPLERCAEIAIETILNYKANSLEKCFIYCYNDKEYQVFTSKLKKYYKDN